MQLQKGQRTRHFVTNSNFSGAWNEKFKCMDGFGQYKSGDGCVYRGYVKSGLFNGYASVSIHPINFVIDGIFHDGRLVRITDMKFNDGIRVQGEMNGSTFDFSKWEYCSPQDRRLSEEIIGGLKGVDPRTPLALSELSPGTYDAEYGIYSEKTGFLFIPNAKKTATFIQCPKESDWIKKYCRSSRQVGEVIEPSQNVCEKTIMSNINCRKWLNNNYGDQSSCNKNPGHKYFIKLYNMEIAEARKNFVRGMRKDDKIPTVDEKSISSASSFSDIKLKDQETSVRFCDEPKGACVCDTSLSINMSALNTIHALYGEPVNKMNANHSYFDDN